MLIAAQYQDCRTQDVCILAAYALLCFNFDRNLLHSAAAAWAVLLCQALQLATCMHLSVMLHFCAELLACHTFICVIARHVYSRLWPHCLLLLFQVIRGNSIITLEAMEPIY
jgi:hypothetical protein